MSVGDTVLGVKSDNLQSPIGNTVVVYCVKYYISINKQFNPCLLQNRANTDYIACETYDFAELTTESL